MLRPATPLAVLMGGAFVLLLLTTLSVPIIKGIPLGSYKDTTFGAFGACVGSDCSTMGIGYDDALLSSNDPSSFDMSESVRHSISYILVLHPVAALLSLILLIMAICSHIHAASHSSRYLLVLFLFNVLAFVVSLVAFVVDLLLFLPHTGFGTYLVLAATIVLASAAVVAFAMRRTIVGRKSRQKRINENAEMSGENYYNREGQPKQSFGGPAFATASGANGAGDDLPAFATFENKRESQQASDERLPLTATRTPSNRVSDLGSNVGDPVTAHNQPQRSPSVDRYGNPLNSPTDQPYGARRTPSFDRMSAGRGGAGYGYGRGGAYDNYNAPSRGRGGYGPGPGRGAYGPRGGRGGYGPNGRGSYGPGGMRGGRVPPPSGGYAAMAGGYGQRGPPSNDGYSGYGRRPSDPNHPYGSAADSNNPSMPSLPGQYESYNTTPADEYPRVDSPPPLAEAPLNNPAHDSHLSGNPGHEAIEMDATPTASSQGYGHGQHYGQIRDSDTDVEGMVNMQQTAPPVHEMQADGHGHQSTGGEYVPPRAMWSETNSGRGSPRTGSPNYPGRTPYAPQTAPEQTQAHSQQAAYYQDSENRYADRSPPPAEQRHDAYSPTHQQSFSQQPQYEPYSPTHQNQYQQEPMYEEPRTHHSSNGRARSPANSDRSNFTSISQRGVNPRWNGNRPPVPNSSQQRIQQQRQDVLLNNPDFQLGSSGAGGGASRQRGAGGQGMIPTSAYPPGPM